MPTVIDLCPAAGHAAPGKGGDGSTDVNVLHGLTIDSNEYLLEVYTGSGLGCASQYGGVVWVALEHQVVLEIDNYGRPASQSKPSIARLVN